MSAKHSPGPWEFLEEHRTEEEANINRPLTICDARDNDLANIFSRDDATVPMPREEAIANARLIAAAPELLSGLNGCLSLIRRAQETLCAYLTPDSPHDDRETLNILLEMFDGPKQREIEVPARAAITKATRP